MQRRYIDLSMLEAGDIFLSRPKGQSDSMAIALLGATRFSHAEIYLGDRRRDLPEGVSNPETCEATVATHLLSGRLGLIGLVRNRVLPRAVWSRKIVNGQPIGDDIYLIMDVAEYAAFEVRRWKGAKPPGFAAFQEMLAAHSMELLRTPYAEVRALARLTPLPWFVGFLARISGWFPKPMVRGLFCSQLVALLYEMGGFPLFENLSPEDVTPRALWHCERLETVTERLQFSPDGSSLVKDYAQVFARLNEDTAGVRALQEELDSTLRTVRSKWGVMLEGAGHRGRRAFEHQMSLGLGCLVANQPEEAVAAFQKAIRILPSEPAGWHALQDAYVRAADVSLRNARTAASRLESLQAAG